MHFPFFWVVATELLSLLQIVDPGLEEAGGEIDAGDPTFTVAEGSFFNYSLATFGDDTRGASAHNPYLRPINRRGTRSRNG